MAPHALRERVPQTLPRVLVEVSLVQESMNTSGAMQLDGHGGDPRPRRWSGKQIGRRSGGAVPSLQRCATSAHTFVPKQMTALCLCHLRARMMRSPAVLGDLRLLQQVATAVVQLAMARSCRLRRSLVPSAAVFAAPRPRQRPTRQAASAARAEVGPPSRRWRELLPVYAGARSPRWLVQVHGLFGYAEWHGRCEGGCGRGEAVLVEVDTRWLCDECMCLCMAAEMWAG